MRTRTLLIVALLGVLGLGSAWLVARPPPEPHDAEKIVREAQAAAAAAATRDSEVGPIPVAVTGQDANARLDDLDAWFAAWRSQPPPPPSGDRLKDDALAVARVQARGRTLLDLSQAYRELADDSDPKVAARARTKLSEIHLQIADDLRGLPAPAYLTAEQKAAFRENVDERIADQENRAAAEKNEAIALMTREALAPERLPLE